MGDEEEDLGRVGRGRMVGDGGIDLGWGWGSWSWLMGLSGLMVARQGSLHETGLELDSGWEGIGRNQSICQRTAAAKVAVGSGLETRANIHAFQWYSHRSGLEKHHSDTNLAVRPNPRSAKP